MVGAGWQLGVQGSGDASLKLPGVPARLLRRASQASLLENLKICSLETILVVWETLSSYFSSLFFCAQSLFAHQVAFAVLADQSPKSNITRLVSKLAPVALCHGRGQQRLLEGARWWKPKSLSPMAESPRAHSVPVLLAWPLCSCPCCSSMDIMLEARGSWLVGSDAVCLQHQPSHPHIDSDVKGGSSPSAADGGSKKGGTVRPSQGPGTHLLCPSPPFPLPRHHV